MLSFVSNNKTHNKKRSAPTIFLFLSIISENVPLKIKNDNKTWKKQKT